MSRLVVAVLGTAAALALFVPPSQAAVFATVHGGSFLSVYTTGNADDTISVTCEGGDVRVSGQQPENGPTLCSAIAVIDVLGGLGANVIDLSAVTNASFPNLGAEMSPDDFPVTIDDGSGEDVVTGSAFRDLIFGAFGSDEIGGGEGNDLLVVQGTDGNDVIEVTAPNGSVTVASDTDSYTSIERFSLLGRGGDDELTGAGGDDTLIGGGGDDDLDGAGGIDGLDFLGTAGNDVLAATPPAGSLTTSEQTDTYVSIEEFFLDGLDGDDQITGGWGDDLLIGAAGTDRLLGGAGDDWLYGDGAENETWDGQDGSDLYSLVYLAGAPGSTLTIADSGPAANQDRLLIYDCYDVTVTETEARRGADVVAYSGLEVLPCGFSAPPPPPPGPPPAPPPPAPAPPPAPPPAPQPQPQPQPKPKPKVKRFTVCHNGRTKKVTKKQLAALRKQVARANKKRGVKKKQTIRLGACKKPKKRR